VQQKRWHSTAQVGAQILNAIFTAVGVPRRSRDQWLTADVESPAKTRAGLGPDSESY
jgi:hypothetical protein